MDGPGQTFIELAMAAETLAAGEQLLTPEGDVRTWGMHLTRAVTPLRIRELDVRQALRSRSAALHRVVADKRSQGNQAWRSYYERGFGTQAATEAVMVDVEEKLFEAATPVLLRLRAAGSELGLTNAEIKAEFRDAGFGKEELEAFFRDDYLPYTRPTE